MTQTIDNLTTCRDCQQPVSMNATACPCCGAPKPWNPAWSGTGYEYKSAATLMGLPVVHIAIGRDKQGKLRKAHGIIAIGQFGRGVITIAQFGVGFVFIGQFGIGVLAIAQFTLAAVAVGQIPIAIAAVGQIPICLLWGRGQVPIVWQ